MLDIAILLFLQNIIIVTIIFWALFFIGNKFFKTKNYKSQDEVFECGFLNEQKTHIKINLQVYLIGLLAILYDIEFLFLMPWIFNQNIWCFNSIVTFFFLLCAVVITIAYDVRLALINWHI